MNTSIVKTLQKIHDNGWTTCIVFGDSIRIGVSKDAEIYTFAAYTKSDGTEEAIDPSNLELVLAENVVDRIKLYEKIKIDIEIGYAYKVNRKGMGLLAIAYDSRENKLMIFSERGGGFEVRTMGNADLVVDYMIKFAPLSEWIRV